MKKILLTGVNGQVGHALQSQLNQKLASSFEVVALSRSHLDLTDAHQLRTCVKEVKPDYIINPAAYTAVDKAESEPALAMLINADAPRILAEEASRIGASLIHFSTDYVFDGSNINAYIESDEVNPLSIYGKSKLAGEQGIQAVDVPHLILRTSWVYGAYGKNFFHTVLRLAAERDSLRIVSDQLGAPTSSNSIANGVVQLLQQWDTSSNDSGVYHFTNNGSGSWHRFACEIINLYNTFSTKFELPKLQANSSAVMPITTEDFPTPAVRPQNSRLNNAKLLDTFGVELSLWKSALDEVMQEYIQMKAFKALIP